MKTDVYTALLPSSEPASPLGRIQSAGYIHQKTGYLPWRVMGSYALVYVLEGGGRFEDASGFASEVTAGDLLLLFPEIGHRYGPGSGGRWAELHIIFQGKAFDLWRSVGLLDVACPLWHLDSVEEWSVKLAGIASPPGAEHDPLRAVAALLSLLTEASTAQRPVPVSPAGAPWLHRARSLLAADLGESRTSAEVAAKLKLSTETFRKTFERLVGVSPARYRAEERLQAAHTLLLQTAMTSRQIAESLGFPDEFYFSRRFRLRFGASPREYRRLSEAAGTPATAPQTHPPALTEHQSRPARSPHR